MMAPQRGLARQDCAETGRAQPPGNILPAIKQTRFKRNLGPRMATHKDIRREREKLDDWYRNRRLDWDEEKDGAFWGYRGRPGARM